MTETDRPILVTGGAGFVGANLADALASDGHDVLVLDSLARPGVERNLEWLCARHPRRVRPLRGDVRDADAVRGAVAGAGAVFHLAAQVAVTTSVEDPVADFEVNARGTLNVLEAARACAVPPAVIFASTNKVYGSLSDARFQPIDGRWAPAEPAMRKGIAEDQPLHLCTPYGCSKGVADQYVLDYATSFGVPAAVLRMSCIYGPRQFGTEDQGWVAHFLIRARARHPITIFGDGRQVRDVLHVSDAVRAYRLLLDGIGRVKGHAFNLGGGPANAVSLLDVLGEIEAVLGRPVARSHAGTRIGDQAWYVSDTRALSEATSWRAVVGWRDGLGDLARWLDEAGLPDARQRAVA
jgi:CDP-paratose 2-epimerase